MIVFPEIAKYMSYKKLRHKDLAKVVGVSQQAITKKLNGESEFKRSEMKKIQKYFSDVASGITMDKLFFCPDDSYRNQKKKAV